MAGYLLALVLVGSSLHAVIATDKQEKDSDVKYNGPVVYTNLPPPVLYFPTFPEKSKISNRGSSGDTEDKRVDYVPFPYKDLPLLVYKSDKQPPVHVVEKRSNQDSDETVTAKASPSVSYQTGPAVYRAIDNAQFGSQPAEQQHPIHTVATPGLATSQEPSMSASNQQYISIGLSSIHHPDQPSTVPQQHATYFNPAQFSGNPNDDQGQYEQDGSQGEPSFMYYQNQQYPPQGAGAQVQEPSLQISQAIQNYMLQQSQDQQHAQSMQQSSASYGEKPADGQPSPMQHVGITIIRPAVTDVPDQGVENSQQYQQPVQIRHPQGEVNSDVGYGGNQQYVSIGVFPVPANDYDQESEPYFNAVAPAPNGEYQNSNEDYSHSIPSPAVAQNQNAETGYQLISIDLSSLRNQQIDQQRNTYPDYSQQNYQAVNLQPAETHSQQMYRVKNPNSEPFNGGEKAFQQILIQIPQNIVPEHPERAVTQSNQQERPYRGTAQVASILGQPNKMPNTSPHNRIPIYKRPPPPGYQQAGRPRHPGPSYGFPQTGINIAIIKQTDSTNNAPQYRPPERIPYTSQTNKLPVYHNQHPGNPLFPPVRYSAAYGPSQGPHSRPTPFNSQRFNRGHEIPASASSYYPSHPRHPPQGYRQQRKRPVNPHHGPEIYQSSNIHFSATHPSAMKMPPFKNPVPKYSPAAGSAHASSSINHPRFVPFGGSVPFSPNFAESAYQAITNNITDDIDDINFDYINAFLDPNYDFYGLLPSGQDPKKEEENKFIQTLTSELITQDFNNAANIATGMQPIVGVLPPFGMVKPHPSTLNVPFPYKYWEQPIGGVAPHKFRGGMLSHYSHFQNPHMKGNMPFGRFGRGRRKHRFGKGVRGLKGRLAYLRSSIRQKKIAPRQETAEEGAETEVRKFVEDSDMFLNAAPRSTIIKTDEAGLDGISIPLNPDVLSSRVSADESENEKPNTLPPIIVYEGTRPPHEVYGTKEDIENIGKNETKQEGINKASVTKKYQDLSSHESEISYTAEESGYLNYMYSVLPDLIRDTLGRRHDGHTENWSPVGALEYALAEDAYDRNDTSSPDIVSPIQLETVPVSSTSQNSSANSQPSVKETIDESFPLLAKEEKTDLVP